MSLIFFLAQDSVKINHHLYVVVPKNMSDFLYDFKDSFENYNYYHQFDPYGETYVNHATIEKIKIFSISITKWLEHCGIKETHLIDSYNLSFSKIKTFAEKLTSICDVAMDQGYGLLGQGD